MRVFVLDTGRRISPFGDRPGDCWFGRTTFGDATASALARRGHDVSRVPAGQKLAADGPCLLLADHCYVSDKCVGDFLAAGAEAGQTERLALCRTPATDYARPVSSVEVEPLEGGPPAEATGFEAEATERCLYDLFYVPAGGLPDESDPGRLLEELRGRAAARVVKKKEVGVEVRLPLLGDPEQTTMIYPVTSTVAGHVEHWVHVLWLNHQAFGVALMEQLRKTPLWGLRAALSTWPPKPANVVRKMVHKGKGVKIHPTATVEGSLLGDGCVVGARASVRNSVLGAGVEVGDHASVIACTLGDRAYVTPKTFFVWSTAFPDAVVNNMKMQMSVLGRGAASNHWAGLIDAKFQGSIGVIHDGAVQSTEKSFLGSCLGHESYIGAKAIIMPGREIPNGTYVTMRPDELITEIPEALEPGVAMVRDRGTLVPLSELRRELASGAAIARGEVPAPAQR